MKLGVVIEESQVFDRTEISVFGVKSKVKTL